MKALNVNSGIMVGHAHELQSLGFGAVLIYLRSDRVSREMVDGLHSVGIKVGAVYESGLPVSASYFSAAHGQHDANQALIMAKMLGMPNHSQIFTAVDYDASIDDINGPISAYQSAFRMTVGGTQGPYLTSVYGSGLVCETLIAKGIAHTGWLSGSTGWAGYASFRPKAAIIQGKSAKVFGFDVDYDTVVDSSVLW